MATYTERLTQINNNLLEAKTTINDAFHSVGLEQSTEQDTFQQYADYIRTRLKAPPTIQVAWVDAGLANWIQNDQYQRQVRFIPTNRVTTIPYVSDSNTITVWQQAFISCQYIEEIPSLDTTNGTRFLAMFSGCVRLKKINGVLDVVNSESGYLNLIFDNCTLLEEAKIKNLCSALDLSTNPLLSQESIDYIVENAIAPKSTVIAQRTIKLGEANYAKLTSTQIQRLENLNYIVEV